MSSTWYVHPTLGDDGNSGTSIDFAWLTLAHAESASASGDTIVLMGGVYGATLSDVFVKTCDNLRIVAYSAATPPIIRSGRLVEGWTQEAATNVWWVNIGSGKNVQGVVRTWGLLIDGSGRYTSDTAIAANLAACILADNSYFYDDAVTDRLYVNFSGVNPNTNPDILAYPTQWLEGGITALVSLTGDGNTIEGIVLENQRDISVDSFGVLLNGGSNTIQGCITRYMAWHALAFTGTGGYVNSGNIAQQNVCWGAGNTVRGSAIQIAAYAGNGNNMTGLRVRNNVCKNFAPLLVAGTPASAASSDGFYHHCGAATYVADAEYRDNAVTFFENSGNGYTGSDPLVASLPADNSDAEVKASTWPIRYYNNKLINGYTNGFVVGGVHVNGNYLMPNVCAQAFHSTGGFTTAHKTAFIGCHMPMNLYGTTPRSMFLLQRGASPSRVVMVNTNCPDVSADVGSGTPDWPRLFTWEGGNEAGSLRILGCALRGNPTKGLTLSVGHSTVQSSSSAFTFTGNLYYQIDPAAWFYDGVGNFDTAAEFLHVSTGKDPGAENSTNPTWVDLLVSGAVAMNVGLLSLRLRQAIHTILGVNGRAYGGRYGAWQDGTHNELLLTP